MYCRHSHFETQFALTNCYLYGNVRWALLNAPFLTLMRCAAVLQAPDALPPASRPTPAEISNRHWMRLEIAVTHTKHSPDPSSNRHKNTPCSVHTGDSARARSALDCGRSATALPISAPPPSAHAPGERDRAHAWGSRFRLLNAAHTPLNCARTSPTRRVAQAGVGLCAVASAFAFPPLTSSRGPFTGRRISLRLLSVSPRPLTSPPVATQLIISNRSARRLEMPETYTKQRTDPLSNRHKFTHCETTSTPTSSPHLSIRPLRKIGEPAPTAANSFRRWCPSRRRIDTLGGGNYYRFSSFAAWAAQRRLNPNGI
jgi:hypothetical protein